MLVIFGQQEYIDLRITRSGDGGKTWSEPAKYGPTQKVNIYPGSLTTLADGRVLHVWNVWYPDKEAQGGKSRFAQFSLSDRRRPHLVRAKKPSQTQDAGAPQCQSPPDC